MAAVTDADARPRERSLRPRSPWSPLRAPTFRNLLIADVLSDVGTFMQSVGAAWLMVSLGAGPMYVALTQTASSLPFFLLALPAGSIGDIVDRRRLILITEAWMVAVTTLLAVLTIAGAMTPWLLLALTFAISAGDALELPTWRSLLPELVPRADLAAASALNGIEFNLAARLARRSPERSSRAPGLARPLSSIRCPFSASSGSSLAGSDRCALTSVLPKPSRARRSRRCVTCAIRRASEHWPSARDS